MEEIFILKNDYIGDTSIHVIKAETYREVAEKFLFIKWDKKYLDSLTAEEKEIKINLVLKYCEISVLYFDKNGIGDITIKLDDCNKLHVY